MYQHECDLFQKEQVITKNQQVIALLTEQVQAPPPVLLNKYQANCIKTAPIKGYVYRATSINNAQNHIYKIGYTDTLKKRKIAVNSS